jgi:Uma2 family endonuclease
MVKPSSRIPPADAMNLLALPGDLPAEIVDGEVVEKAAPTFEHGDAQGAIVAAFRPVFHRPGGGDPPGGWWIATEVEVELAPPEVYRPDVVGWRRARVPERPTGRPVRIRPDWVCEILSASTARYDQVTKLRVYERCGVPHYWLVDPDRQVLTVYRLLAGIYQLGLVATSGERGRAEPFEAIELDVGSLFGAEPAG